MTKKTVYKIIIILLGLNMHSKLMAAFFTQSSEGWHWYQDPIIEQLKKSRNDRSSASSPTEIINAYKQELAKKLHLAILQPTAKNIQAYQEMQKDVMQRSQNFAIKWMQVIYKNPKLDHTLVAPVNQIARHIYLDQAKIKVKEAIYQLKKQYGLVFFGSSHCEYCQQFAPIVQQFADKYDWQVMVISLDGGNIAGFKEVVPDNGMAALCQVPVVPALFAVNPKTEEILPVAFGLTTLDQIEERIMTLIGGKYYANNTNQ
jgi:conjugal transfer pilus assembly protein TraF